MNETNGLPNLGPAPIAPKDIRYIKLGSGGAFARSCIEAGVVGLAFETIPHELCLRGDWPAVHQVFLDAGKTAAKANDHIRELRAFYELGADTLWITFADNALWWAFAKPAVTWLPVAGTLPRQRKVVGAWRSSDLKGVPLAMRDLSTRLTRVGAYRSTICKVEESDYLIGKINGEVEPLIHEAIAARTVLRDLAARLIQRLHEKDFELLVDLIFAASGWRRVSVLGETEKDVDLLVEQIAIDERAFVQVKSKAGPAVLNDYVERFRAYGRVNRMVFACHSPSPALAARAGEAPTGVDLWFAETLAEKAVRAGLFDWLLERVR